MKKILIALSILLLISCGNDKNDPSISDITTKDLSVIITLPSNAPYGESDLTVSSLFSQNAEISDGQSVVEIFDENAIELVFATNSQGNIVFLNLVNPSLVDEVELNATTTAQSLVLIHPWVMNLSVEARQEAYNQVALMPEFQDYKIKITQGILEGRLDPQASNEIISVITNFRSSNKVNTHRSARVEKEILPLSMLAEDGKVTITNKVSSMAYNLQLYDENNKAVGEATMVNGVNKEILSFSTITAILSGNFDLFQPQKVELSLPSMSQAYKLNAESWTGDAALTNGANITASVVGIISTTLGEVIKNAKCGLSVGQFFLNNAKLIIEQLTNKELTNSQAMSLIISFIGNKSNDFHNIVQDCPGNYTINSAAFNKMLKALSIVGNIENGHLLFFNAVDVSSYDSEIEFCFEKKDGAIQECNLGEWFVGTYELGNYGGYSQTNLWNSCGENQIGEKGEVYIYLPGSPPSIDTYVITYAKSIINEFPNIYYKSQFYDKDIYNFHPKSAFRPRWNEEYGGGKSNPLNRGFNLGWLDVSDNRQFIRQSTLQSVNERIYMYSLSGSSNCNEVNINKGLLFGYEVRDIKLISTGSTPPNTLNQAEINDFYTLLNDAGSRYIVVE